MDAFLVLLKGVGPAALGWSLLSAYVITHLRGLLVPASQVQSMREDADKRVDQATLRGDQWFAVVSEKDKTIRELVTQNGQLLEGAHIARAVMAALPKVAESEGS